MLKQNQRQKLLQKLSPQQIQIMKLLQIPTTNLEERIKDELEDNPALEYGAEESTDEDTYGLDNDLDDEAGYEGEDDNTELSTDTADKIDIDEFLRHEDDYGSNYDYSHDDHSDNDRQPVTASPERSFQDYLLDQLGMLELDERRHEIAEQIIGSIDDDGYLRREVSAIVDDLAFARNIATNIEEVSELINQIRRFDPPGVAAWTLQECLMLQLKRIHPRTLEVKNAMVIIDKYFTEFTKKHYEKIQRQLLLDDESFREVINVIIRLTPKPGASYGSINKAESYVIPDFFISNNNGRLELTLNAKNAPELRISEGYKEMLKAYDRSDKKDKRRKEALLFIKQKLDSAKWFIDAIRQRQQTLLHTMQAIMHIQEEFFLTGDETTLRPMILKDVALLTNQDVSTVSRVASSKFVQTEFGTYKLKYFFSEALHTDSGEEVSTREVKSILSDMIANEDKKHPLSDDRLTEMLQEKGYNIARRTVAKYREYLNVPIARLRRQL